MKRRTKKLMDRRAKREQRKAQQYRSLGDSRYARKVKAGQMYGPMPAKEAINRLVGRDARVQ